MVLNHPLAHLRRASSTASLTAVVIRSTKTSRWASWEFPKKSPRFGGEVTRIFMVTSPRFGGEVTMKMRVFSWKITVKSCFLL